MKQYQCHFCQVLLNQSGHNAKSYIESFNFNFNCSTCNVVYITDYYSKLISIEFKFYLNTKEMCWVYYKPNTLSYNIYIGIEKNKQINNQVILSNINLNLTPSNVESKIRTYLNFQ